MAHIQSIVIHPGEPDLRPKDYYNRVNLETANLKENHGIDGDHKAGKHPDRQINIMFLETLTNLRKKGFNITPGQMGEQIVIDGLTEKSLEPGSRFQIGDGVQVEVTKPRSGCDRFEAIQELSPKEAVDQMGVYVKVLESGTISVGGAVRILEPATP